MSCFLPHTQTRTNTPYQCVVVLAKKIRGVLGAAVRLRILLVIGSVTIL